MSSGSSAGRHDVLAVDELPARRAGRGSDRSRSSVSVSCCQPPRVAMASLRQMPPVPLKLKSQPGRGAGAVLDEVVAVEHERLHAREQRVLAVQVAPARLDHADLRVGDEVRDDGAKEVRLREEVGVEDGDELALGDLQPVVERARLVAGAVDAVDVHDVEPRLAQALDAGAHERAASRRSSRRAPGSRGGSRGYSIAATCIEQARGDRRLVVERELDGHVREVVTVFDSLWRAGRERPPSGCAGAVDAGAPSDEVAIDGARTSRGPRARRSKPCRARSACFRG